jgi:hypothetical protein
MEINNVKLQNDLRTEIEMSFKRSELEIQRRHREILDYVQKLVRYSPNKSSTEGNGSRADQMIEKNAELIK